jgi:uncharacterized protein
MPKHVMIHSSIVQAAKAKFELDMRGIHGPSHWGRVAWHGRQLAQMMHEPPLMPALFGLLHDSCRSNEDDDAEHGARAENFVIELSHQREWPLDGPRTRLLRQACRDHSEGFTTGPTLVKICWDADRLDLGRVGITPDPRKLCTEAAKDQVRRDMAFAWSRGVPLRKLSQETEAPVRPRRRFG